LPTTRSKDISGENPVLNTSSIYHPKLRARMPELGPQYNANPQNSGILGASQFVQQMAELQMNSPRNGSQIF